VSPFTFLGASLAGAFFVGFAVFALAISFRARWLVGAPLVT
jgi:hypothetical protein